jgi:hypothetical protein
MTSDKDAMEKAAWESYPGEEVFPRIHQSGFKAGWRACLDGPAVTALVEALEFYSNKTKLDCGEMAKVTLAEFEKLREASK